MPGSAGTGAAAALAIENLHGSIVQPAGPLPVGADAHHAELAVPLQRPDLGRQRRRGVIAARDEGQALSAKTRRYSGSRRSCSSANRRRSASDPGWGWRMGE